MYGLSMGKTVDRRFVWAISELFETVGVNCDVVFEGLHIYYHKSRWDKFVNEESKETNSSMNSFGMWLIPLYHSLKK